jgi:cyclase
MAGIIGHPAGLLVDPVIDGCPPVRDPVPDWGNVIRRPPTLTTLTAHVGDRSIEIKHAGHPRKPPVIWWRGCPTPGCCSSATLFSIK